MQRKREVVKGGAPINRIRENSRLMHTHESMVDFINGRHPRSSLLDVLTSSLFGFRPPLDEDIIYSDDDDDEDDDYDDGDHFHPHNVIHRPLEPHPRIRQLTDEEADKHAKELIEEEERRKERTERNKRKKMRKKEKKRLEKENKVKEVLPVEEQGKSDSSENQEENSVNENDAAANESPKSVKTQNTAVAVKCDGSSDNIKEKEEVLQMNMKEEEEKQTDLQLNNSFACLAISAPEETCNERPARDRKKKKNKLVEDQQSKEEKPAAVEKPEVQKKEETNEPNKETTVDPTAEEFAIRSRELAGIGNRLAASGQFEMAVKYFTDAIKYNPKEFKLFGNRSLCFERMKQYENALSDADISLCMQPNWIKGLFRKGKALCGLKRYYEASLIYKEVLQLDGSSAEAMQELKRAQTLHLMEMGFSWEQSSKALKTHATLEEAVEALFAGDYRPEDVGAGVNVQVQPVVQEQDNNDNRGEGEWVVLQTNRPRMQQIKESDAFSQSRSKSQSPTPLARNSGKPELFPIWVGSLAPAVTYSTLHEVFSRAGTVYSIKMLLEHQCAFVNYTKKEDCDRAIQCINGMVVEGAPLTVRYPNRIHAGLGVSKSAATDPLLRPVPYKKECFFWRTTGCTRSDCTYKHVPEHKNIDKDKFTGRLGNFNM